MRLHRHSDVAAESDAQDAADIVAAEAAAPAWHAAGSPAYPLAVVRLMRGGDSPLRTFRKHEQLTQKQFAAMAGLGQGYLSDLENGRKLPSADVRAALAKALDTNEASLLPLPE